MSFKKPAAFPTEIPTGIFSWLKFQPEKLKFVIFQRIPIRKADGIKILQEFRWEFLWYKKTADFAYCISRKSYFIMRYCTSNQSCSYISSPHLVAFAKRSSQKSWSCGNAIVRFCSSLSGKKEGKIIINQIHYVLMSLVAQTFGRVEFWIFVLVFSTASAWRKQ